MIVVPETTASLSGGLFMSMNPCRSWPSPTQGRLRINSGGGSGFFIVPDPRLRGGYKKEKTPVLYRP